MGRNENNLGYSWKQLLTVDWTTLSWNENNLPYSMDAITKKKLIGFFFCCDRTIELDWTDVSVFYRAYFA